MGKPADEELLAGGFVNAVVLVGSTVHRSTGPWTPAVQALLRHLEAVGFRESPRDAYEAMANVLIADQN